MNRKEARDGRHGHQSPLIVRQQNAASRGESSPLRIPEATLPVYYLELSRINLGVLRSVMGIFYDAYDLFPSEEIPSSPDQDPGHRITLDGETVESFAKFLISQSGLWEYKKFGKGGPVLEASRTFNQKTGKLFVRFDSSSHIGRGAPQNLNTKDRNTTSELEQKRDFQEKLNGYLIDNDLAVPASKTV